MTAGLVLGAILAAAAEHKDDPPHSTSNYYQSKPSSRSNYSGCHGSGCDVDTRPQFDKEGNPNFDTHGNYQGCHGVGCLVDSPEN